MEIATARVGLNLRKMNDKHKSWILRVCQMRKSRTASGKIRMRKMRDAFNREFAEQITYDSIRFATYQLCEANGIPRYTIERGSGVTYIKNEGAKRNPDSLLSRVNRQDEQMAQMSKAIAELTQLVTG